MSKKEAETLIRRQIRSGSVWEHRDFMDNGDGLEWAFQGSEFNGTSRDEMVAACAELITDPDVSVRTGIARVLNHITDDLGADWLTATLESHPELYVGVEPVGIKLLQPDLEKEMLIAIASSVKPGETRSIALLRKAAHDPTWGFWMINTLSKVDSDWLCEHPELIPHGMIYALVHLNPAQRERIVLAKAPWPPEVVDRIASDEWSKSYPEVSKNLQELFQKHHAVSHDSDGGTLRPDTITATDTLGPSPTYMFRTVMVLLVGCLSIFFPVFLFWGSRLTARSGNIKSLNEMGDYKSAKQLSEETRKKANTALVVALATALLFWGIAALMVLQSNGWRMPKLM